MIKKENKNVARLRRHARVRKNIHGTKEVPRLNVFRSNNGIYVQVIDIEAAKAVGADIAKKCLEKKIKTVVFDRGGYLYHGRVAALADAARENGLKF